MLHQRRALGEARDVGRGERLLDRLLALVGAPTGLAPVCEHHLGVIRDRDRVLARLRFDTLPSRHPYLLMLPQDMTEKILAEGLANAGGAAPTPTSAPVQFTEIPSVTAIPSQFGGLGAIQLVVGAGDENGTRLKLNLETPSLNSFVYEYMTATC